ncbi:LON peptidase N-terminal domain and RING finger protein 2 [Balamuthia mandrillaris]
MSQQQYALLPDPFAPAGPLTLPPLRQSPLQPQRQHTARALLPSTNNSDPILLSSVQNNNHNSNNHERSCDEWKRLADESYENQCYEQAVAYYTHAIALYPTLATLYQNRAAALSALQREQEALADTNMAMQLLGDRALADPEEMRRRLHLFAITTPPSSPKNNQSLGSPFKSLQAMDEEDKSSNFINNCEAKQPPTTQQQKLVLPSADDFECVLCMKLYYEPTTTSCGHTFCKDCLLRALDHTTKCPLCRAELRPNAEYTVTVALQQVVERFFPELYAHRKEEMLQQMRLGEDCMPLFPLRVVLFPGMNFPLHIFEPRYRLMLRRCLNGKKQFGLVNVKQTASGWALCDVGCTLQIKRVNHMSDGRSHIETTASKRFRILDKWETDGYMMGRVEWFEDEGMTIEEEAEFQSTVARTRMLLGDVLSRGHLPEVQNIIQGAGDIPSNDNVLPNWLASVLPVEKQLKQNVLELRNPLARARYVHDVLVGLLDGSLGKESSVCNPS